MKPLFQEWEKIAARISRADSVLLCLDYDGTLTPIVDKPEWAKLSPETRGLLDRISRKPRFRVAVVSGRSLADVRGLVGLNNIIYAGNHGLELEGPSIRYLHPEAEAARSVLENIAGRLREELNGIAGLQVEDKKLTLSIHFRRVPEKFLDKLFRIIENITRDAEKRGVIAVTGGKKVIEIRPPADWDKGKIVRRLQTELTGGEPGKILAIYLGDDRTDEDAFRAIHDEGVTVRVGGPDPGSRARYYLDDPGQVLELLKKLK